MNCRRRFRLPRIALLALLALCASATAQTRDLAPPAFATTPLAVAVAFRDVTFRDHQPLVNRLKRIQAVALVTVWDSTSATLYLGVNRDGEPGLHLRQKKHDRGTLAPAHRTLFSDVTPWRATIRLASQSRRF